MARECEVCGKKGKMGNQIETRGKAKYLGGVGTKVTGITRRKFKPNLQTVKITTNSGQNQTVRVCAQCLRSGAVRKAVRQRPFRLTQAGAKVAPAPAKASEAKPSGAKASGAKAKGGKTGASGKAGS